MEAGNGHTPRRRAHLCEFEAGWNYTVRPYFKKQNYFELCYRGGVGVDACGVQKRVSNHLELVLQVVVSCLMLVLGTEPESSARAASALNI